MDDEIHDEDGLSVRREFTGKSRVTRGSRGSRGSHRAISSMHQHDKFMRELFEGVARAILALDTLRECARIGARISRIEDTARESLVDARSKYDLIAVRFLAAERDSAHYFSAVSCANIESTVRELCADIYAQVARMRAEFTAIIARADESSGKMDAKDGAGAGSARVIGSRGIFSRGMVSRAGANTKRALARGGARSGSATAARSVVAVAPISASELCECARIESALGIAVNAIARECGIEVGAVAVAEHADDSAKCASCGNVLCIRSRADDSMVCDKCGRIDLSRAGRGGAGGVVVGDEFGAGYRADVMMSRRAGSHHLRHLKSWMDRLQAIESYDIRADELDRVRQSIMRECGAIGCVSWHSIQCKDVARHIAICGLSHLNKHVPKVVKSLGGRAPPIYDYDAIQIIVVDFEHIMEIYPKLVSGPGNKPYYPFFISKIVRMRFAGNAELLRIIDYITQQGFDTVKKNDHIFEQICKLAPPQYALRYQPEIE